MKKGWIIYKDSKKNTTNAYGWMIEEGEKQNLQIDIKFHHEISFAISNEKVELYYEGKRCELPDFVLFRCYDDNLFEVFKTLKIKCFNDVDSMRVAQNKWSTHLLLTKHKIPTPTTLMSLKREGYTEIVERLGAPFVVKTLVGSGGDGVFLVKNSEEFNLVMDNLHEGEVIFQRFIDKSYGKDIRAYVIGGKVEAAVVRKSESDFRSNFSLGGTAEEFKYTEEIEEIAVAATKALGLEIAGVDILFDNDGYSICEVNGNAGFRTIWQYTNVSIPEKIMKYISEGIC